MTSRLAHPRLVGHTSHLHDFWHEFQQERLPHGLLITGPQGIGKAALAIEMARSVLTGEYAPSLDNQVCRRIDSGAHADMCYVQPAIHPKTGERGREISAEQAREISEFLSKTAGEGGWRVVIIDSADQLNRFAANAILKILEEPPPRVLLLLISHQPASLLVTIRSRCRVLKCAPLTSENFAEVMRRHEPDLPTSSLEALATLSHQSPGLALKLHRHQALDLYRDLLTAMSDHSPDTPSPLFLDWAEKFGTAGKREQWEVAVHLLLTLLQRLSHCAAGIPLAPLYSDESELLTPLAHRALASEWERRWQLLREQAQKSQQFYMDMRQMMLTLCHLVLAPA